MFEKDQVVYCLLFGKGIVVDSVYQGDNYPVTVMFNDDPKNKKFYTSDGRYQLGYNRTLYFSEQEITAQKEPPFKSKLIGKNVMIVRRTYNDSPVMWGEVYSEGKDYICLYRGGTHINEDKWRLSKDNIDRIIELGEEVKL